MTNSKRLATVRAHLRHWLAENAAEDDQQPKIVGESILVRDGFYCGRSFAAETHRAVWFIEEDELKIHGPNGEVVATFAGEEIVTHVNEPQMVSEEPASEDDASDDATDADVIKMPTPQADDESRRAA